MLNSANEAEKNSAKAILDANRYRKDINRLRAKTRKSKDASEKERLMQQADKLASTLSAKQRDGALLREKSKSLKKDALNLFEEAMVDSWRSAISSRRPIMMENSQTMFFAHNTKFRSVHPTLLNKMGTPSDGLSGQEREQKMSILVPALAEQNAPPNLDISSFQLSRKQEYMAHIELQSTEEATLNKIHRWHLFITDLSGEPLTNGNIEVVGHMPGHVHGLPTQPRVTRETAPGVYLVDGLKFQMQGWWVMQFNILSAENVSANDNQPGQKENIDAAPNTAANSSTADSIVFNLVL